MLKWALTIIFFELGGHSLLTVQLINQIKQWPDCRTLTPTDVFKYPTLRELAGFLLVDKQASSDMASFKPRLPQHMVNLRGARPTFIVPGLPGLSDGYYELAERLALDGEVYGLQMRGFFDGEQPATTVEEMAAHNLATLRQINSNGKINLYAHSYGGTVVYEMLKQLLDSEYEIGEVVFIDSGVLKLKQDAIDKASVRLFCQFLLSSAGKDAKALTPSINQVLDHFDTTEWQTRLSVLLEGAGALEAEQFRKIWRVVEAAVSVKYPYGPKLPYRLTLVVADASKGWLNKQCWDPYFESVRVIQSAGDHMSIVRQPDCDAWLRKLQAGNGIASDVAAIPVADPYVLRADELRKHYPKAVQAVDGVSLSLNEGVCFGLLGPNGAGKTTTLEMLEGIIKPSSGQIYHRGKPINAEYRKHIGIQFQHTALPELLTVKESLQLFQKLYPSPLSLDELVEACALTEYLNRDNRKLSGGQRQRLLLAIALINNPDIVFLDEPTTGLDPQARHNFWSLIRNIKARGKTIILTTHYMDEAEQLCDEIAIMDKGRILVQDTPQNLLANHFDGVLIKLPKSSGLAELSEWSYPMAIGDDVIEFVTPDVEAALRQLAQHHISLDGLSIVAPNLENLFLKLTGYSLRA
ncbi:alpha/beta fold hydrolase [Methylocucumis oryzae]|uniref:alpha/beta fold hydrolase n=1 Tax=Methylocucumis oryzae TaxID=1632867 RepID=UPI0009E2E164|nr:alpha/beta fold hydrolase [Methylocucumis oryzae]